MDNQQVPTIPPIPNISLSDTPPVANINPTPSQQAASSLSSSIETDLPISEVVAALQKNPSSSVPVSTPAPISTPTVTTPAIVTPLNISPATEPALPVQPTQVATAPDSVSNPHVVVPPPVGPITAAIPVTPITMAPPANSPLPPSPSSLPQATPTVAQATAPVAQVPPTQAPTPQISPLFEDPDQIKIPGQS